MKNYEEVRNAVFEKAAAYEKQKRSKRQKALRIALSVSLCLAVFIAVTAVPFGLILGNSAEANSADKSPSTATDRNIPSSQTVCEEQPDHRTKKVMTSHHKDFKYPPILPIVYFEGTGDWTAVMNLKDRIYLSHIFDKYIVVLFHFPLYFVPISYIRS